MLTRGLSLDQAPPLLVPLRFFLTAPWYLVAAGLLLAWEGAAGLNSRWTPDALALTHLISLGFCTQIMFGAMLQLLPVLAGARVPAVLALGRAVHVLLNLGTLALVAGLLGLGTPWLAAGGGLLALAVGLFASATSVALAQARGVPPTVRALSLGLAALLVTLVLGLVLVGAVGGWVPIQELERWVNLHLGWGLLGWVGLPLAGLLIELVPMFYITPAYPGPWRDWPPPLTGLLLLTWALALYLAPAAAGLPLALAVLLMAGFAVRTLVLSRNRLRPVRDTTLFYLWAGCAALVGGALAWFLTTDGVLVGVLILGGVCIALPSGMLYKIVPFLCWFHLQGQVLARGRFDRPLPTMKTFLRERHARAQGGAYLLGLGLILLGHIWPGPWLNLGGLALAAAALGLAFNLSTALARYRRELTALASLT